MKYLTEKKTRFFFQVIAHALIALYFHKTKQHVRISIYIKKRSENEEEEKIFVHHYISVSSNYVFFSIRK